MKNDRTITKEKETVILPVQPFSLRLLQELWEYMEFMRVFIKRNYKTMYAQTVLGPLWFLLTAILSSSVMTLVFGKIAGLATDGTPQFLFYMAGNLLWNDFSGCLTGASSTFLSNTRLMGKVWFPRLCVPIAEAVSKQIRFLNQLALFELRYLWMYVRGSSGLHPSWTLLLSPLLIAELILLAVGIGLIIAALTAKYRDLAVLVSFFLQLWMYATPVVYPISQLPESWRGLFLLNPVAPVMETFRWMWFGNGSIPTAALFFSVLVTLVLLGIGVYSFQKAQQSFMDVI